MRAEKLGGEVCAAVTALREGVGAARLGVERHDLERREGHGSEWGDVDVEKTFSEIGCDVLLVASRDHSGVPDSPTCSLPTELTGVMTSDGWQTLYWV